MLVQRSVASLSSREGGKQEARLRTCPRLNTGSRCRKSTVTWFNTLSAPQRSPGLVHSPTGPGVGHLISQHRISS